MKDMTDQERAAAVAIADALRTYPLAPNPPTLFSGTMARIRALPTTAPPRFHIGWIDYAIGLFTTTTAGVSLLLWQSIPPQVMARLQVELLILLQRFSQMAPHLPSIAG